ncbi:MAG: gluconate 2-dehydrogenase subunit 3 family protein [Chloroflexi bacterium]|nr:gluconate 2-dehydrogenase subunit 3 family protein [Chloroflexota bacterium]
MPIRNLYPTADILSQRGHWDDATRRVVLDRVHNVPSFQFFNEHERATLEALCARVIPQGHRPPERRVPIAPWIDRYCAQGAAEGFRFDDMPDNATAWRLGLQGLDETAKALFFVHFVDLTPQEQDQLLESFRFSTPPGEVWLRLSPWRWWINVALQQITGIYYAHPYAWDEIGFGGPAYPRGYAALNFGAPEPWEPGEVG